MMWSWQCSITLSFSNLQFHKIFVFILQHLLYLVIIPIFIRRAVISLTDSPMQNTCHPIMFPVLIFFYAIFSFAVQPTLPANILFIGDFPDVSDLQYLLLCSHNHSFNFYLQSFFLLPAPALLSLKLICNYKEFAMQMFIAVSPFPFMLYVFLLLIVIIVIKILSW